MMRAAMLLALLVASTHAIAAASIATSCPPPADTAAGTENLPHLAAVLKAGGTVEILAVGAVASTPGLAAINGFTQLLGQDLEAALPGLHVTITPRGGRGQDASAQLELIRAALKQHRYDAVLWQTGTFEAVRSEPVETFYQALSDGADATGGTSADLILVEPQYSRFLEANADPSPYLAVMQARDAAPGTLLFHRYELMHDWEESGAIDLEHAARADRPAVAARLHACLAAELARAILSSAGRKALR